MIYQREDPAVNGSRSRLRHRTNKPRFARQPSASAAVANAVDAAPPENKGDVASAAAAAAVNAAPLERKGDVASAAVANAVDAATAEHQVDVAAAAASAAVDAAPPENKGDVASAAAAAAVNAAPLERKGDVATAMIQALPRSARQQTIGRLVPDQHATNKIWMWIVITFAIVLSASIVALIGAIFVSAWHKVDPADVQVLLTVVTTVAGILAGFIGGRASKGTG